jgi:SMI1 / KNR4 family (SUKH-1)
MGTFDWRQFLENWSQDYIACIGKDDTRNPEVLASGWLGFPGATEVQIAETEARLSIRLPSSYREFLKISNGWRQTTPFIYRILAVEEVEWFHVRHADWIASFSQKYSQTHVPAPADHQSNGAYAGPIVSDADYLIYGSAQDCSKIRVEYLSGSLEISEKGESSIYLLNPKVINAQQEWEAWFFGDWLPGADRYPSFQAMMEAEYKNFLDMRDVL